MTAATLTARGEFEVTMTPEAVVPGPDGGNLSRLALDKHYHGNLEATGAGFMLSALTSTTGSAGYVAMELVKGTLHGRAGSFVLQHTGIMNRGAPQLSIAIVPDSGTGELTGISGSCGINITGGKHYYELHYSLPVAP